MKHYREIYRAGELPVFQNRMFHSEQEAKNCTKDDVVMVQDLETGLVFIQGCRPDLMQYDADHKNEQAVSAVSQLHPPNMSVVIANHVEVQSFIEGGVGKANV